jgi:hypothetical protein
VSTMSIAASLLPYPVPTTSVSCCSSTDITAESAMVVLSSAIVALSYAELVSDILRHGHVVCCTHPTLLFNAICLQIDTHATLLGAASDRYGLIISISIEKSQKILAAGTCRHSNVFYCTQPTMSFTTATVTVTTVTHLLRTLQSDRYGLTIPINIENLQTLLVAGICHSIAFPCARPLLSHTVFPIIDENYKKPKLDENHNKPEKLNFQFFTFTTQVNHLLTRSCNQAELKTNSHVIYHKDYG